MGNKIYENALLKGGNFLKCFSIFQYNKILGILYFLHLKRYLYYFILFIFFLYSILFFIKNIHNKVTSPYLNIIENYREIFQRKNKEKEYYEFQLNEILNSKDYKRYQMFKETGVKLPQSWNIYIDTIFYSTSLLPFDKKYYLKMIKTECGFNPKSVSCKGASGPCQLMPNTKKYLKNKYKNNSDFVLSALYLKELFYQYENVEKTFRHYNAGTTLGYEIKETNNYVKKIIN